MLSDQASEDGKVPWPQASEGERFQQSEEEGEQDDTSLRGEGTSDSGYVGIAEAGEVRAELTSAER